MFHFQPMGDPVISPEAQQVILMKRNTHQNGIGQSMCQHWCRTSDWVWPRFDRNRKSRD